MTRHEFDIPGYGWHVRAFYDVTPEEADEVIQAVIDNGCQMKAAAEAYDLIASGRPEVGFTHPNYKTSNMVVAVSRTQTASDFYNTLQHEIFHIVSFIAKSCGLNPYGERVCYLAGDISQRMFVACHKYLCDRCRNI